MRRFWLIAAAMLVALPVWAQSLPAQHQPVRTMQPPQQQQAGLEQAMLSYRLLGLGIEALMREREAEAQGLRLRITDMDAYLKACRDQPGCTAPVAEERPK